MEKPRREEIILAITILFDVINSGQAAAPVSLVEEMKNWKVRLDKAGRGRGIGFPIVG